MGRAAISYAITSAVEAQVVAASLSSPSFHGRLGKDLDPARMPGQAARLLLEASATVARRTGYGCSDPVLALQVLRDRMDIGQVTLDELGLCEEYVMDLPSRLDEDQLVAVVAPVVARVLHEEAVKATLEGYKAGPDGASAAAEALSAVARVGKGAEASHGLTSAQALDATVSRVFGAETVADGDLLSTGCPELDDALEGGLERKALGVVAGGPGTGKSLYLSHVAATAALAGHDVFLATLELSPARVWRRVLADLLDMTTREIRESPAEVGRRYALLRERGLGEIVVESFDAYATTCGQVEAKLLEHRRRDRDYDPRLVVLDYLGLMTAGASVKKLPKHEEQAHVSAAARNLAFKLDGWCWAASQVTREKLEAGAHSLKSLADSMGPGRTADLVVGIGRTPDDLDAGKIRFNVPKVRDRAGAHTRVGPLDIDFERGRPMIVVRDYPW